MACSNAHAVNGRLKIDPLSTGVRKGSVSGVGDNLHAITPPGVRPYGAVIPTA